VECKEKQRLIEDYFDSFKRQRWMSQRVESMKAAGDSQSVTVAEKQLEAATEECYDAWRAMNEHQCSKRCAG
jgi:DNA polymerase I-like protein with 3'-5' exonuclease and polymerase domains